MYLNVKSYYSLCYGTISIENLVEQACGMHIQAMALTDINNTMGMVDFVFECKKYGIKPIAGCEFRNEDELLYIAIARNNEGFREINETLTQHNISKMPYGEIAPQWNNVIVIYPFGKRKIGQLNDNEFIGIRLSQVSRLLTSDLQKHQEKLVVAQPVTFLDQESFVVHKNLRAIDKNILISRLENHASDDEILLRPDKLRAAFALYPQILKTTDSLMEQCGIDFDFATMKNKKTFTDSVYNDIELLRKLAFDGMRYRYGLQNKEACRRIAKELDIIEKMQFASYFLIAADVVRYSMSKGIHHVGRGSGANSIVAYCLRITDVDPIELDLYFERFLNPKRSSPPDFDIDYSWKDRDEVHRYMFSRYDERHVALLGATTTFRDRSVLRELGKVHGLPKNELDNLCRSPERYANQNAIMRSVFDLAQQILDFPNVRSIHAGGVLITEQPITCYSALDMPPKGFLTTQWDMYVAERLKIEKLDILSQRGIGHIHDAVEIIRKNRGVNVDIHRVEDFKKDETVKSLLRRAETNGCFYIESPAMRGLLRKLCCDDYKTLVAASSIIRPGVARSGMMRQYIQRFHDPQHIDYLHPMLKQQLQETYGVMVYQEDVLKVCHYFAGLDLSDADVLRRMMNHKSRRKDEMTELTQKFFDNCKARGYSDAVVREVWRQIESFAGYSFSKAHSASYAVESYQSLYLKAHFPLEFQVAVINNFGGFYPTWVYFNEFRRQGGIVHLPCVNVSEYLTTLHGRVAYMGFVHLQGLEAELAQNIVNERVVNGKFRDVADFMERLRPKIEQIVILIRSGAFSFTGKPKPTLLWEAHVYNGKMNSYRNKFHGMRGLILDAQSADYQLPAMNTRPLEDAYDEIELFGFPVTMTWFDMLKTRFRGEIMADDMLKNVGRQYRMLGHLVSLKYVKTCKGDLMHFANFLDAQGNVFDATVFPNVLKMFPFQGNGTYLMLGKIVEEFGHPSIEIQKLAKMEIQEDPRAK
ncbi:MAG: DNA polymerase III subunit alpha [Bacteroidales bacterium]|nr:DNA polymerase III subunit alpha [Bacteroidales bacterium]